MGTEPLPARSSPLPGVTLIVSGWIHVPAGLFILLSLAPGVDCTDFCAIALVLKKTGLPASG